MSRSLYIGGTVAAAVMGESDWSDANAELFKAIAIYAGLSERDDLSQNRDVMRGRALEPIIIEMIKKDYDATIRPHNKLIFHRTIKRMGGHPDAVSDVRLYEIKAPRRPPPVKKAYFWQMVHYVSIMRSIGEIDHYSAALAQLDYENWRVVLTVYDDLSGAVEAYEENIAHFCEVFDKACALVDAGKIKTHEDIVDFINDNYNEGEKIVKAGPDTCEIMERYIKLRQVKSAVENEMRAISSVLKQIEYGTRPTTVAFGRITII